MSARGANTSAGTCPTGVTYISLDDAWGRSMEQALREATRAATVPVTAIRNRRAWRTPW